MFCKKMTEFNSCYFFHQLSEIKILAICTPLIYVQLISKTTTFYLDNCRRSYLYSSGSLYAILCKEMIKSNSEYFFHQLLEIKTLAKSTPLIYVQLFCRTTTSHLKTVGGVICTVFYIRSCCFAEQLYIYKRCA